MSTGYGFDLQDGDWVRVRQLFQIIGSSLRLGPTSIPRFAGLTSEGDLMPATDNAYDIGETTTPLRWKDIKCAGSGRFDGGVGIGVDPSAAGGLLRMTVDEAARAAKAVLRNDGAGDALLSLFAGSYWSIGIDNSDGDKLLFAQSAALGSNVRLSVTTAGAFDFQSGAIACGAITGGTYNTLSVIPITSWIYLSGDGTTNTGLDIAIPVSSGDDFFYGFGGTEHHKFGNSSQVEISDDGIITAVTINAFSLGGKLTGGANEIEGSAFDINGGTIDGVAIAADCTQTEWDAAYTHVSNDGTDHSLLGATAGTVTASKAVIVDASKDIDFDGGDITTAGWGRFDGGIGIGTDPGTWDFEVITTSAFPYRLQGSAYRGTIYSRVDNAANAHTSNSVSLVMGVNSDAQIRETLWIEGYLSDIADATRTSKILFDTLDSGSTGTAMQIAGHNVLFPEKIRIGSTTAPTVALDVTGAAKISTSLAVDTTTLVVNATSYEDRVGIGTATPGTMLEIQSSSPVLRLRDTGAIADATAAFVEFGGTEETAWSRTGYVGDASSGDSDIYLEATVGDLHLGDSSGHSVLNLNGGNVGIGLTAVDANYKLIIRRAANVNLGIGLQSSELAIAAFNDALSANIPMRFYASEFNLLNGNVGINETTPQDKLEVNGTVLVKDKLKFTQDDGNEYIDSLADGYMDYGATTGHRFNANVDITGTIRTTADQDWNLGAASAQADFAGDTKIRVTIGGTDYDIVALAV